MWDEGDWAYSGGKRTINGGNFDLGFIHRYLAVKVRLQGKHAVPKSTTRVNSTLEEDLEACAEELWDSAPHKPRPACSNILSILSARYRFSHQKFDRISANFQSVVARLGEYVSGDEKLDHFTGNSGNIRLVPSKPARIGLWHYQLVGIINNTKPYLLDAHLSCPNTQVGHSDFMGNVVNRWASVIQRINCYQSRHRTIMCFDAYYMDNNTRSILLRLNQPYSGAIQAHRFTSLAKKVDPLIHKPGDFGTLYNPKTHEVYTKCWDHDSHLGKRTVLCNYLNHAEGVKHPVGEIPAHTAHGVMFNGCDRFNASLHGRMWPRKKGGRDSLGDLGKEDDFIFSSALVNTWNVVTTTKCMQTLTLQTFVKFYRKNFSITPESIQTSSYVFTHHHSCQ